MTAVADRSAPGELLARLRRDADRSGRRLRNGLKHLAGIGRPDLAPTPKETVWTSEKVQLWRYGSGGSGAPPLLFVHSLVSRSYVFDLVHGNSVVETMLEQGFDVYLLDWGVPDEMEAANTLEAYTDLYLPLAIERVSALSDRPVSVFGYCLGGVLSLLSVAGNTELPVRNLAVMATPVDFSALGPLAASIRDGRLEPADLVDATGNVPASVIRNSFRVLRPTSDVTGLVNLWQHLWNEEYLAAHAAIDQWSTEHIPFPGAAFLQMGELFMRRNLLPTGRVPLGGRTVDLASVTVPFLNIVGEKDHLVPPAAIGRLTDLVGSTDRSELRLPAGHAGLIVGRTAQRRNLPAMAEWLHGHGVPG